MGIGLLDGLNRQQQDAVIHSEGPLLILAGAGSGKTRVLTHRIAYLVKQKNVDPSNILAFTFTNKAAREMKDRIEKLVGDMMGEMWVGTFHATCMRILRKDIDKLGFSRGFAIYDQSDQLAVVKDCLKELNLSDKYFPPRSVLDMIGKAKDELIEPDTYRKAYASDFRLEKVARIYELYQDKLRRNNALDFDDIIISAIRLLIDNPPVLGYYQSKFRYVLVDEYQDTNTAQYSLISLLAQGSGNLCVVGDDDQMIFGWRGANIRNILDFEKEFRNCRVIKLEQNYRSTGIILDAANNVIKNNSGRKSKKLWTDRGVGCRIVFRQTGSEIDEADYVASEIRRKVVAEKRPYNDFAVLYRIHAQSRTIEDVLMRRGIPYRIYGGLRFYDRKEVKDVTAYLRLLANINDNIALKRIINVPRRGIGDATVEIAERIADSRRISIYELLVCADAEAELKRARAKISAFVEIIEKLREFKGSVPLSDLLGKVLEYTGMVDDLKEEGTEEARSRLENIEELVSAALEFERENEGGTLEDFLEQVSLVMDIDSYDTGSGSIALMTLHSAKGLEFPVVFMVGMEEGVFPGYRSIMEESGLEEERRLCYVGMTRAMEKLYLSCAVSRTLFGKTSRNIPSRFIREIPRELIDR